MHKVRHQSEGQPDLKLRDQGGLTAEGVVLQSKRFDLFPHRLLKVVLCFCLYGYSISSRCGTTEASSPRAGHDEPGRASPW